MLDIKIDKTEKLIQEIHDLVEEILENCLKLKSLPFAEENLFVHVIANNIISHAEEIFSAAKFIPYLEGGKHEIN